MDVYKNSLFLSLILRFWTWVCDKFRGGLFYRFFTWLARFYKRGFLHWLTSKCSFGEDAWKKSRAKRAVEWCLNLIPNLLNKLYEKIKPVADTSFFVKCLTDMGRYSVPVFCVMVLVMLVLPQTRWNNLYSLIFAFLALVAFWLAGIKNPKKRLSLDNVGPWPCIYALTVCLSLIWSDSFSLSFRFIFFAITCMLCVVVFANAFDTEKKLMAFLVFLGAGLFVSSAYALYQRLTGVESNGILTDLTLNANMPGRVYSFFENPNSYANLLVYFTPLMLCMFFFAPKRWQRLGFGAVFALCALALVMTYSRGGWLAFGFSIFILMCLLCPRWIPLVMAVGVLCLPILPSSILNRLLTIFNMSDSSTYTRTYIYAAMLRIIKLNPIFGVGLGADTIKHSIEVAGTYTAEAVFIHGHNIYFQIGAEAGLIGLVSFILSVFCGMRSGGRRLKKKQTSPLLRGVIAGCISGLSGSMLFGLTDYPWSYPRVMVLFWLLFALLCAATGISKNKKAGKTNG